MFHLAAFKGSLGQTANTDVAALTDGVLSIANSHFRLVDQASLVAAAVMSATMLRARLDSPSLRINGNPYILPPLVAASPGAEPRLMDLTAYPLQLPVREELALQATSGLACGTETAVGLVWVSMGFKPVPPGRVQWVRLTSTTACVAYTWTQATFTFETSLPSGYWAVVGMRCVGVSEIACRLTFPGQVYRPGVMALGAASNRDPDLNWNGSLGEFGRFVNDNPPLFELLNVTNTASHDLYLGLVQVGSL